MAAFELSFGIRKESLKKKVSEEIAFALISLILGQIQEPASSSTTTEHLFLLVLFLGSFLFGTQRKWSLVMLDRWSSYAVTIVWEFAWADSALVVSDKWPSYRGSCLNRFDCSLNYLN